MMLRIARMVDSDEYVSEVLHKKGALSLPILLLHRWLRTCTFVSTTSDARPEGILEI